MDYFNYRENGQLFAEECNLSELAAEHGTPLYVYSRATIERHWHAFDKAAGDVPHLICYAVKANSNLAVLNLLARLGSGFDIVSGGELARVIAAGGDPAKVVFSGVAKTDGRIRFHKNHTSRLAALFAQWEQAGLTDRILTFDGSFNLRLKRGSTKAAVAKISLASALVV